jgi:hypothetical protein
MIQKRHKIKMNKLEQQIKDEIKFALKQFGEYTFRDKGSQEVMGFS